MYSFRFIKDFREPMRVLVFWSRIQAYMCCEDFNKLFVEYPCMYLFLNRWCLACLNVLWRFQWVFWLIESVCLYVFVMIAMHFLIDRGCVLVRIVTISMRILIDQGWSFLCFRHLFFIIKKFERFIFRMRHRSTIPHHTQINGPCIEVNPCESISKLRPPHNYV